MGNWFKSATSFVSKALAYTPLTGFGALNSMTGYGANGPASGLVNKGGKMIGVTTPGQSKANRELSLETDAMRNAALKKAHDEEVAAMGAGAAEALKRKRARGLYATILTGTGPTMSPGTAPTTLGHGAALGSGR